MGCLKRKFISCTLNYHLRSVFGQFQKHECAARCFSVPACTHYVWKQLDFGTCFFKSGAVIKMEAIEDSDTSHPSICGIIPLNRTRDSGSFCRFIGKKLDQVSVPQEQCIDICQNNEKCTHYVWTESNGGTCFLKDNTTASMSQAIRTNHFSTCGLVREKFSGKSFLKFRWNEETNSASGCDFTDANLKTVPTTREECPTRCSQSPVCTHYVW